MRGSRELECLLVERKGIFEFALLPQVKGLSSDATGAFLVRHRHQCINLV